MVVDSTPKSVLRRPTAGVVHTAAWTDVDGNAREPGVAMRRNGTAVGELATACATRGLDLIVTDHHPPDSAAIPDALAVLNPTQPGCPYPNMNLCGAAVAFKLAQALLDAAAPLTVDADAFRARTRGVLLPSLKNTCTALPMWRNSRW